YHIHLRWGEIEKPARLDDLKPFIHQGRAIDRDAIAHLPGWMIERLLRSHEGQLLLGGVAKGPARGGQNQLGHLVTIARPQALMGAIMLAIDRQEVGLVTPYRVHD